MIPLVLLPPWRRAYVEPVIGTIRQECVDHLQGGVFRRRQPAALLAERTREAITAARTSVEIRVGYIIIVSAGHQAEHFVVRTAGFPAG